MALQEVAAGGERRGQVEAAGAACGRPPGVHGGRDHDRGPPSSSARRPATRPMMPDGHGPRHGTGDPSSGPRASTIAAPPRCAAVISSRRSGVGRLHLRGRVARSGPGPPPAAAARRHPACPTRPRALMRGASVNETVSWSTRAGSHPPTRAAPRRPGRRPSASSRRPMRVMARFSPSSGTTSAMEPMAARSARPSANCRAAGPVREQQLRDLERDPGTRQPRHPGTRLSARCGLTTAAASGRTRGQRVVVRDDDVDTAGHAPPRSRRGWWTRCRRSG